MTSQTPFQPESTPNQLPNQSMPETSVGKVLQRGGEELTLKLTPGSRD